MRTSLPNLTALAHDIRLELVDITAIEPTGSAYTCNPPVLDTDIDFICKVESMPEFKAVAVDLGWEPYEPDPDSDEEEEYDLGDEGDFTSFRRDDINLIVTQHQFFYDEYVLATSLCKRFNLLEKKDRCALFSAIIDGPPRPKEEKPKNPELVKEAGLEMARHKARETLRKYFEAHGSALVAGSLNLPTTDRTLDLDFETNLTSEISTRYRTYRPSVPTPQVWGDMEERATVGQGDDSAHEG